MTPHLFELLRLRGVHEVHVGIIRSSEKGNLPHILKRIASHRKAMWETLSSGTAQKSRVNPIVGKRLDKLYDSSVLFSSVSVLYLLGLKISMLNKYVKSTYQNIWMHPEAAA